MTQPLITINLDQPSDAERALATFRHISTMIDGPSLVAASATILEPVARWQVPTPLAHNAEPLRNADMLDESLATVVNIAVARLGLDTPRDVREGAIAVINHLGGRADGTNTAQNLFAEWLKHQSFAVELQRLGDYLAGERGEQLPDVVETDAPRAVVTRAITLLECDRHGAAAPFTPADDKLGAAIAVLCNALALYKCPELDAYATAWDAAATAIARLTQAVADIEQGAEGIVADYVGARNRANAQRDEAIATAEKYNAENTRLREQLDRAEQGLRNALDDLDGREATSGSMKGAPYRRAREVVFGQLGFLLMPGTDAPAVESPAEVAADAQLEARADER